MDKLNLPDFEIRTSVVNGKDAIFDIIRKKFVHLTPEEWVRQHFVHYLIDHLGYPRSLIKIESGLHYNRLAKRADIIIYNSEGRAVMVVECKSPSVRITQDSFHQAAIYNQELQAEFIVVTNGIEHHCSHIDFGSRTAHFISEIPGYRDVQPRNSDTGV